MTIEKGKITHDISKLPTGELKINLMNDYMFKAVFQENMKALEGLLYALLNLPKGSINSIVVENPIELGRFVNRKTCVLDLKLILNNNRILNVEMQVGNYGNWIERSIVYLCRAFDQLKAGDDYGIILPTMHIGIIDFDINDLTPMFYSENMLMNTKNHEVYSDKFALRVLNLNRIDDATAEEKESDLYTYARMFKARTWEEIKMLAQENEYAGEVIYTLHEMSEDEKIAEQCFARKIYEWDKRSAYEKGQREGLEQGRTESQKVIDSQKAEIERLRNLLAEKNSD